MSAFLSGQSLANARAELRNKSCAQIEWETAAKWAARAVAAMELYSTTGELRWALLSGEFRAEAIEHAAAAGDGYADAVRAELDAAGVGP